MSRNKRVVIAGATSVVLIAGVVIATLTFGIVPVPNYQTFAEAPLEGATGRIAYIQPKEGDDPCLYVISLPSTDPAEVVCAPALSFVWLDNGNIAVTEEDEQGYEMEKPISLQIYDPVTMERTGELEATREDGSYLLDLSNPPLQTDIDHARVLDGDENILLDLGGPRSYYLNSAQYSPDKQWFVLSDTEGRILISNKDGSSIRTLVEFPKSDDETTTYYFGVGFNSGSSVSWFQPNNDGNTVSVEQLSEDGIYKSITRLSSQLYSDDDY